jgi:methylenetetrahydrofolate reductase (NADPH)
VYSKLEARDSAVLKGAHGLEFVAKALLYGCRDCGDCSLPEIGFLCPESQCAKNLRNGPCGGSRNGRCEIDGRHCIWVRAYYRFKATGAETAMLDRSPVIKNGLLQGTSAWANTFLGRDHLHIQPDGPARSASEAERRGSTDRSQPAV